MEGNKCALVSNGRLPEKLGRGPERLAAIRVTSLSDVEAPMEEGTLPMKLLNPIPRVRSLGEAARLSGRGPTRAWYSSESSFRDVRLPKLAATAETLAIHIERCQLLQPSTTQEQRATCVSLEEIAPPIKYNTMDSTTTIVPILQDNVST